MEREVLARVLAESAERHTVIGCTSVDYGDPVDGSCQLFAAKASAVDVLAVADDGAGRDEGAFRTEARANLADHGLRVVSPRSADGAIPAVIGTRDEGIRDE